MYYHIKIEYFENDPIYYYNKDLQFVIGLKKWYYSKDEYNYQGLGANKTYIKNLLIIKTPYDCETEVNRRNYIRLNSVINTFVSSMLFAEYENIIDELN